MPQSTGLKLRPFWMVKVCLPAAFVGMLSERGEKHRFGAVEQPSCLIGVDVGALLFGAWIGSHNSVPPVSVLLPVGVRTTDSSSQLFLWRLPPVRHCRSHVEVVIAGRR